ncbi:hypothetical protein CYLTODRAFT_401513 [Cylindrobasidium torrendii FP15055 ss-10]|uniref:Rab-GAP TBC domain-containing protein n=1 Tax=Cylindrobasidium torrendii FP15055 ss-10 TaxID=1314674 RepID=A0A0D7B2K8_9AGAR|nr:hypothetical protein CYLTODRAFT_401513 [Cylindrobasidium torrendii FP15055 ss-10]
MDEKAVVPKLDWDALRKESILPGGFGDRRVEIWPQLLGVNHSRSEHKTDRATSVYPEKEGLEHSDERQIRLDTDRSFVLYPVDETRDRTALQDELNKLLVSLFRRRPKLNYFQGYHDIVTVFFLTLPQELQFECVESLSLHRVRDAMGMGLEPVLGLVRIIQNLLKLADPEYSEVLERTSPLPFYALSNVLTLFSHDMPTLPLVAHVFDYLLARPPIYVVYLATAVILARKDEVRRLEEEDEDGMIHSLLSSLPNITDGEIESAASPHKDEAVEDVNFEATVDVKQEASQEADPLVYDASAEVREPPVKQEHADGELAEDPIEHSDDEADETLVEFPSDDTVVNPTPEPAPLELEDEADELDLLRPTEDEEPPAQPTQPKTEPEPEPRHTKASVTLSSLLIRADALATAYPPTHPDLGIGKIMGPASVIHTWRESGDTLNDDEAEEAVRHPERICFPPEPEETAEDVAHQEKERHRRRRRKLMKRRQTVAVSAVLVLGLAVAAYGMRNGNGNTAFSVERLRAAGVGGTHVGSWMRSSVVRLLGAFVGR